MIADKITLLNAKVLECLNETDEIKIVKTFTEVALKVLEADFGFVWLNSFASKDLKLVYKSLNLPFMPHPPRPTGRNYRAMEGSKPDFVSDTRISVDAQYVSPFVRSFVIIPLVYKKAVYGSMVICFKEQEIFSKEKRILSSFIGNSVAETILIRRLIRSERQARLFSEAQGYYFRALFENSHEIIVHISKTGKIVYVSQSIKKILGVEVDDVIGKNVRDFGYNQEGDAHFNYLQNLLQKPKANHVVEFRYRNKDGTVLFLESTSAYLPKTWALAESS